MNADSIGPVESASVRERIVDGAGSSLFVRQVGGEGPGAEALLVLPSSPGISHEPLQLLEVLASPQLAIVNFDPRAVGRSTGRLDTPHLLEQALADLDRIDSALDFGRLHLLGRGWGGLVATLHAAAHPERVASLALLDCLPPTSEQLRSATDAYHARLTSFQARGLVPAELPSWTENAAERLLATLPIYFADPKHPAARSLGGASLNAHACAAARSMLKAYDVRQAVKHVTAPSLHFIASVPFGPEMATTMADALGAPLQRRVRLTDAGDLAWLERPDWFVKQLQRFLGEIAPATALLAADRMHRR